MRLGFRIYIYSEGKRLKRTDLRRSKEPFWIGVRYITEFKYLEATKWLLLSEDSQEKYMLLALIHTALGQRDTAREFLKEGSDKPRRYNLDIEVNNPESGLRFMVKDFSQIESLQEGLV
jgi:hypothetical protein